ncbi:hypothetical protein Taro_021867 [Colocasia esculenta]|uniref:Uncharacterized protein n=1 Tax=Colocasia esculenta TaxID=4460 RepID=A0A843V032_COLES|nr:hypothetical protein [Colocasia esculenta]
MYTAWNLGIPLGLERRLDTLSRGIGLAWFGYVLTHLWSTSSGWFVQVAADEKGKKNGLVWTISCSPATKNYSTRPQQDVNSSPKVAADEKGKKNDLVWTISCSPAAKNSSTRPQQDVNSSPKVW